MRAAVCAAALGLAALPSAVLGECPNACSGHGACGAKDQCSCYQNYQGNDCSERTCYFGLAHVDTPKGDLNADGMVSGPLSTVVTGSEVYPWGTTEQYPNANANEGHFYMECSNKGLCDRGTGTCQCFDGYTGTACARAACPEGCSGHGTCESIKELAEMRAFDTHKQHQSAAAVAGSDNHPDYDASISESYSYDLWDADKTMGCKCDPGFFGADCSLRKCAYGLDPLYFDNVDGAIHQTTVVHLGSTARVRNDEILCADCVLSLATNVLTTSMSLVSSGLQVGDYIAVTGATCTASNSDAGVMKVAGFTHTTVTLDASHGCTISGSVTARLDRISLRSKAAIGGTFRIVFYDTFGEKYVTKSLSAADATLTPADVVKALQALPNNVISKHQNTDVTGTEPDALTVAMHVVGSAAVHSTAGGVGGGQAGSATKVGAGLGTIGATVGVVSGPELTITFTSNPGILRSIEIDTEGVTNTGAPDYWVANARQGQFSSRYTTNLGRINTLTYGKTRVWTNTDLTSTVTHGSSAASLVKVGGQEFRVAAEDAKFLTLSEPYLGASIVPMLVDTGATLGFPFFVALGTACTTCAIGLTTNALDVTGTNMVGYTDIGAGSVIQLTVGAAVCSATVASISGAAITLSAGHACADFTSPATGKIEVGAGYFNAAVTSPAPSVKPAEMGLLNVDAVTASDLAAGALLSIGGCSFNVVKFGVSPGADIAGGGNYIGGENFDCFASTLYDEFAVAGTIVYRRSDDTTNQNLYMAPSDTGTTASSNLMVNRGSHKAYLVTALQTSAPADNKVTAYSSTIGSEKFTLSSATGTAPTVNDPVFVNGHGPMTIGTKGAAAGAGFGAADIKVTDAAPFFPGDFSGANFPIHVGITANGANDGLIATGSVLLINGRRYRVRVRGSAASGTVTAGHTGFAYVGLSETYAGGAVEKLCDSCVAYYNSAGSINLNGLVEADGRRITLAKYDRVMLENYVHEDYLSTVTTAVTDGTDIVTSTKGSRGLATAAGQSSSLSTTAAAAASNRKALYRTNVGAAGVAGVTVVTESATAATYQYVSQCSNRGQCDHETGLCVCFKGYTRHNCDTQNMLSM
jgi:hypothetical protein